MGSKGRICLIDLDGSNALFLFADTPTLRYADTSLPFPLPSGRVPQVNQQPTETPHFLTLTEYGTALRMLV